MNTTTLKLFDLLRGHVASDRYSPAARILAETKEECDNRQITNPSEERLYEIMLAVADRNSARNPFTDKAQFSDVYQAYCKLDCELDWELIMAASPLIIAYPPMSFGLFAEYDSRFTIENGNILIAGCEKFVPHLRHLVDKHLGCHFTLTSEHEESLWMLKKIFSGYENVQIVNASIYKYGFTSNRYDLIFAVPNFGTRNLAEDDNFMCRNQDAVALENLLLHTVSGGELVITMPARIAYAQGKIGELRRFVQQSYRIKELSELPEGTFVGTGIKTYLITVVNTQPGDDDIIIRRYTVPERKSRRDSVSKLIIEEDTFVMPAELEELDNWNISIILSQQDEDWLQYKQSSVRRMTLGNVAEIFRGKAITRKDPTGSIGVVNISNIGEYDIDYDGLDHLEEEERKVTNFLLKEGDLLIPARGTALRTAIFHEQKTPCIASANVIVIRPDPKALDGTYLKLFLDSPLGKKLISATQQGITGISISYKDLTGIEVPVPSLETQKKTIDEYARELKEYQKSIAAAEDRWKAVLSRLQSY